MGGSVLREDSALRHTHQYSLFPYSSFFRGNKLSILARMNGELQASRPVILPSPSQDLVTVRGPGEATAPS